MKYNKQQKKWLKKEGLWKKVKKYSKKDKDYQKDPEEYGELSASFWWYKTKEDSEFWSMVDQRMQAELAKIESCE